MRWWMGRSRLGRSVVVASVAMVVLGGCAGGPGQAGTAVIVGDTAVPLEVVQDRVDTALGRTADVPEFAAQGIGAPELARDAVSATVRHELIERAAAAEGITVADESVQTVVDELRRSGDSAVAVINDDASLRQLVRDQLLSQQLGERAVEQLAVTVDVFATTSRSDADAAAEVIVAGGPDADALFEVNPQTAQRGTELRATTVSAGPTSVVFGVPVGSTVVLPAAPDSGNWLVVRVTDRRTDAEPAPVTAENGSAQLVALGDRVAQFATADLDLRVNPRFGVWDPVTLRVVAAGVESGVVLPAAAPVSG